MTTKTLEINEIGIGLKKDASKQMVNTLNTLLADEHVLYTKTRNFHWNVSGIHFRTLHALFEEQYDGIKLMADEIAERTRKLGGFAIGSMRAFSKHTRLEEAPDTQMTAEAMLADLLEDHEQIIRSLRKDIELASELGDEGTTDMLTALMRNHESMAWMLRSSLRS
jgi:starvation-inducible DNA-binding protein